MSAGLDCIRDCVFLAFLLSTLKPLFKDVILYCFLMVSTTSYLSAFTFCHWLFLTAGTCWYKYPAFLCSMVKLSLHCHNVFVYLFILLRTAALKMSCNFSAKLVYIGVLDFLMLFWGCVPWNFKSCETGHPFNGQCSVHTWPSTMCSC